MISDGPATDILSWHGVPGIRRRIVGVDSESTQLWVLNVGFVWSSLQWEVLTVYSHHTFPFIEASCIEVVDKRWIFYISLDGNWTTRFSVYLPQQNMNGPCKTFSFLYIYIYTCMQIINLYTHIIYDIYIYMAATYRNALPDYHPQIVKAKQLTNQEGVQGKSWI